MNFFFFEKVTSVYKYNRLCARNQNMVLQQENLVTILVLLTRSVKLLELSPDHQYILVYIKNIKRRTKFILIFCTVG